MKKLLLLFCVSFCTALPAVGDPGLSLLLLPEADLPLSLTLSESSDLYQFGGGTRLSANIGFPGLPWLTAGGSVGVNVIGTRSTDNALTMFAAEVGPGLSFAPSGRFRFDVAVYGGYAMGMWNGETGGSGSAGAHVLASWKLSPQFSLGVGAGYKNRFGLYEGASFILGTSYRLGGQSVNPVDFQEIQLDPVFPILYQYYDTSSLGAVKLRNDGDVAVQDVKVSVVVRDFMDTPKVCGTYDQVAAGEEITVPLYALFKNSILSVTEGARVAAEISVDYSYFDKGYTQKNSQTLQVYNRNAITWDDDRKAAAFVTARDPQVLRFSKNSAGVQDLSRLQAVNKNFRTALVMFEALRSYGIVYIVDPKSSYKELSKDALAIDFLQFPVQSLSYRSGDCDDLSILYNALLEAAGIETAFITVPGHIFVAFSLDMWPEEAEKTFGSRDNLIIADNTTWIPIETTALEKNFIDAWEVAAREWRDGSRSGGAKLLLTHKSWEVYEPVGSPGNDRLAAVDLPDTQKLLASYTATLENYINRAIYDREQELLSQIRSRSDNSRSINALGVLYARYGLYDKAKVQFERVADAYQPARINLGNIYYLNEEWNRALSYYNLALETNPEDTHALLGAARAGYKLENYNASGIAYRNLEKLDPELAVRYSYLGSGSGTDTARAASSRDDSVFWSAD